MTSVGNSNPKRWVPTAAIDAEITRIYTEEYQQRDRRLPHRRLPPLRRFASQIGWPYWAVKKRGRELGLARTKEKPWTERELTLLNHYAHLTPEVIAKKLRQAGILRTVTACKLKLKRLGYKSGTEYYSGCSLARAFGLDQHCITRWVRKGWLRAGHKGTARAAVQGGDAWLIHEDDVRAFIVAHPEEIDLRKVDQRWFLYIITRGEVAA